MWFHFNLYWLVLFHRFCHLIWILLKIRYRDCFKIWFSSTISWFSGKYFHSFIKRIILLLHRIKFHFYSWNKCLFKQTKSLPALNRHVFSLHFSIPFLYITFSIRTQAAVTLFSMSFTILLCLLYCEKSRTIYYRYLGLK